MTGNLEHFRSYTGGRKAASIYDLLKNWSMQKNSNTRHQWKEIKTRRKEYMKNQLGKRKGQINTNTWHVLIIKIVTYDSSETTKTFSYIISLRILQIFHFIQ